MKSRIVGLLLAFLPLPGADFEADAKRGAGLFDEQKCTMCHAVGGKAVAGAIAPDLGRRLDRDYTPAGMASRMWNHAPRMWEKMRGARVDTPKLTEANVADLFAFFYASRYFERLGDAGRGKAVFAAKRCSGCHAPGGKAKPAAEWTSISDPVDLVQRMWNHAAEMKDAVGEWPRLTSRELTDLLVYLQNLPGRPSAEMTLRLPAGHRGKEILENQGCTLCHRHNLTLEGRLGSRTLTDIAASMWNHAPDMRGRAIVARAQEVSADDMREVLAYIWATEFFRARGDSARGGKVFDARCKSCHGQAASGAPDLKPGQRPFNAITMVSALWQHGPKMLEQAEAQHKRWPELSPTEMTNLIAYLDGRPAGK